MTFTDIIGVVDGTHIGLKRPSLYGYAYYNRKGHTTLNVMAVSDAAGRITYLNADWPGSVHDSTVWRK